MHRCSILGQLPAIAEVKDQHQSFPEAAIVLQTADPVQCILYISMGMLCLGQLEVFIIEKITCLRVYTTMHLKPLPGAMHLLLFQDPFPVTENMTSYGCGNWIF